MNGMGRPNCFRTDNGGKLISRDYSDYCDPAGIRREYTAPGKPQQNAVVESAIWRAMKGGHAARLEIGRLFPTLTSAKSRSSAQMATVCGSRLPCGLPTVSTAPRPRLSPDAGHRTRFSSGDCRICR